MGVCKHKLEDEYISKIICLNYGQLNEFAKEYRFEKNLKSFFDIKRVRNDYNELYKIK